MKSIWLVEVFSVWTYSLRLCLSVAGVSGLFWHWWNENKYLFIQLLGNVRISAAVEILVSD